MFQGVSVVDVSKIKTLTKNNLLDFSISSKQIFVIYNF